MILLFNIGGRTGNQLFQVAYAQSRRKRNEWLISVGFGETRSILEGPCMNRWLNIEGRFFRGVMESVVQPVLYRTLVRTGLVASDYENLDTWEIRSGRIGCLRVMKGYFQSSERQAPDLPRRMRLKRSIRLQAHVVFKSIPEGKAPVFVHLRRSDKASVQMEGRPTQIPDQFYLSAIEKLRRRHSDIFFIVLGDDPDYAERLFRDVNPKYISRLSVQGDLALMSMCEGGVLSNSTLAWWGAFYSPSGIGYIAPKYWAGWNVGKWRPPELHGQFVVEYLDLS